MNERIDNLRAGFAAEKILERFGALTVVTPKLKEYRSVALSAPAFLRQCGLLQLAAFYLSKGDANAKVLEDVVSWLADRSPTTRQACAVANGQPGRDAIVGATLQTVKALAQRASQEVALLEQEADAILGWLKRLTEAIYKKLNPNG